MINLGAGRVILESTGQTFDEVAVERGVPEPVEARA
jgi:hypothetical protein